MSATGQSRRRIVAARRQGRRLAAIAVNYDRREFVFARPPGRAQHQCGHGEPRLAGAQYALDHQAVASLSSDELYLGFRRQGGSQQLAQGAKHLATVGFPLLSAGDLRRDVPHPGRVDLADVGQPLVFGHGGFQVHKRLDGQCFDLVFGYGPAVVFAPQPFLHPPVRTLAFGLVVDMRGRPVLAVSSPLQAVGFVEAPDRRIVVLLEASRPVVHRQVLDGCRQAQRADLRLVGVSHDVGKVVAWAVISAGEHDLAIVARQSGDGGRLHAIVNGREHLRLEPSARIARAPNSLTVDLPKGLQVVQPADVVPDHQRLVRKADGGIFIVILRCREDHVTHLRQRETALLHSDVGVAVGAVSVRAEHRRGRAVDKLLWNVKQPAAVDVRPELVIRALDRAPFVLDRWAGVHVQGDAFRQRPEPRAGQQLPAQAAPMGLELLTGSHHERFWAAHPLEVSDQHLRGLAPVAEHVDLRAFGRLRRRRRGRQTDDTERNHSRRQDGAEATVRPDVHIHRHKISCSQGRGGFSRCSPVQYHAVEMG